MVSESTIAKTEVLLLQTDLKKQKNKDISKMRSEGSKHPLMRRSKDT